jgi:uncharacterized membrane protein
LKKTIIKSISWAVVSGLLIFTSSYIATGLFNASLMAAFMASLVKTPVYAAHEPIFERVYGQLQP